MEKVETIRQALRKKRASRNARDLKKYGKDYIETKLRGPPYYGKGGVIGVQAVSFRITVSAL